MAWLTGYLDQATQTWSDRGRYGWAAFGARNLRIETRLSAVREQEYLDFVGEPHDHSAWAVKHRAYDLDQIATVGVPARRVLSKASRDQWPSPFRWMSEPLKLANDEFLVHVASAYALSASSVGLAPDMVADAVRENETELLDDILGSWWRGGGRTIFAAVSSDVADLVTAARTGDLGWADALRDRLGLVHYDPLGAPIDVVMLRYRVNDVPRAEGLRTRRPILAPSALDSSLNPAFCPLPDATQEGRVVDLSGQLDPVREVIHPRPLLSSESIVACGQIAEPVPDLVFARWIHLEWIRDSVGPDDFAAETDADLVA